MKKVLSVISVFIILFLLAGCLEKRSNIAPVTHGISFTADITYYNECFESYVTVFNNGNMKVEMTSPDTIKGMSFSFTDGKIAIKYNELEYKCAAESMPEGIVCSYLYDIFRDTVKEDTAVIEDKDNYYIIGDTGKSDYKMYVGATGMPIKIEESKSGLNILVKNVTLLKEND